MWWWIIPAILGMIAMLAYESIRDWFSAHKTVTSSHGELVRQKLASGNYRVVAGVFDRRGTRTAEAAWETSKLDDELKEKFGRSNRVRVEI